MSWLTLTAEDGEVLDQWHILNQHEAAALEAQQRGNDDEPMIFLLSDDSRDVIWNEIREAVKVGPTSGFQASQMRIIPPKFEKIEKLKNGQNVMSGKDEFYRDIAVTGNPVAGFQFHGPFPDVEAATHWAEHSCPDDCWWTAKLWPASDASGSLIYDEDQEHFKDWFPGT